MINIRYASIRELDISNGEGVGVSLFVQGCNFHCKNCFNPETWDFNGGKEWTEETEQEFFKLIDKSYIKRISILGGEPLADQNLDGVLKLTEKIRVSFPDKTIWLYSGYTFNKIESEVNKFVIGGLCANDYDYFDALHDIEVWRIRHEILSLCDVFVDGKYIDTQRDITLKWRGSENQRVIDIKKSLKEAEIVLWTE